MFVSNSKFRKLEVEMMLVNAKIKGLELTMSIYFNQIHEVLDQNQSIIDTNKIVLDKIEEYLKANDAHE